MRLPNGYGCVRKLSGKRRRPYAALITKSCEYDEEKDDYIQKQVYIGYYATKQEALKSLADYHDMPFDLDYAKATFKDIYDIVEKDFTEHRRRNYQAAVKYCSSLYDMPIREIKTSHLQASINTCHTTQQRDIKTVYNKVFNYAMKNDIIVKNPALYVTATRDVPTKERTIFDSKTIKELEKLNEWWSKITVILIYEGMRTKELLNLPASNIDIDNMVIHITEAKNKSSVRDIPIHTHVLPLICDFISEGEQLPFIAKTDRKYVHDQINNALKKYGHTVYDSRHTFATIGRQCGMDELVLQRILGHTPQTITHSVYTHLTMEELRTEIEKLKY